MKRANATISLILLGLFLIAPSIKAQKLDSQKYGASGVLQLFYSKDNATVKNTKYISMPDSMPDKFVVIKDTAYDGNLNYLHTAFVDYYAGMAFPQVIYQVGDTASGSDDTLSKSEISYHTTQPAPSEIIHYFYENSNWTENEKENYHFDSYGNDSSYTLQSYNGSTWEMKEGYYWKREYGQNGMMLVEILYVYDSTSSDTSYYPSYKDTTIIHSDGFERIQSSYDTTTGLWVENKAYKLNVNSQDVLKEIIIRLRNEDTDSLDTAFKYTNMLWKNFSWQNRFGDLGVDPEEGAMDINMDTNMLDDENSDYYYLYEKFYLRGWEVPENRLISSDIMKWDKNTGQWINFEKMEYNPTSTGGYIGISKKYDEMDSTWNDSKKYILNIDNKLNPTKYEVREWTNKKGWSVMWGTLYTIVYDGSHPHGVTESEYDGDSIRHIQIEKYQSFVNIPWNCNADLKSSTQTFPLEFSFESSVGEQSQVVWSFGDGTFSNEKDVDKVYADSGFYQVTLRMFDPFSGCQDDTSIVVEAGNASNYCKSDFTYTQGTGNTINFVSQPLGNVDQYLWYFGDGEFSLFSNPSHTYPAPGYYATALVVRNSVNGNMDIERKIIEVGDPTNACRADFEWFPEPNSNIVHFINQSVGGNINYVNWNFGDGGVGSQVNTSHNYAKAGFFNVCLTIGDTINNCMHTTCKYVPSETEEPPVFASFFYHLDSLNKAGNHPVSFKGAAFGDPAQSVWDFGDGTTGEYPIETIHEYTDTGYYLVQLHVEDELGEETNDFFGVVNVNATPKLKAMFGYINQGYLKDAGNPVEFKGAAFGDPAQAVWNFGDGSKDSTTLNPVHVYETTGSHTVCLTLKNATIGQVDTYCRDIDVVSVPDGIQTNYDFKVYPNPAKETVNILYDLDMPTKVTCNIYDYTGRVILTQSFGNEGSGEQVKTIDVKDMPQGMYFIEVKTSYYSQIQKLILVQ